MYNARIDGAGPQPDSAPLVLLTSWQIVFVKNPIFRSSQLITMLLQVYTIRSLHRCWPVYTTSLGSGWSHTHTFVKNHLHTQHWAETILQSQNLSCWDL